MCVLAGLQASVIFCDFETSWHKKYSHKATNLLAAGKNTKKHPKSNTLKLTIAK